MTSEPALRRSIDRDGQSIVLTTALAGKSRLGNYYVTVQSVSGSEKQSEAQLPELIAEMRGRLVHLTEG